jgi:hypothetical protein
VAGVWIFLCVAAVAGLTAFLCRRDLQRRAAQVCSAWEPVERELKRRHDLVAALLPAQADVQPSGDEAAAAVADAWQEATAAATIADRTQAENRLSDALSQLRPDHAADASGLRTLSASGEQLVIAAREYNLRVMALNVQLHRFPWRLVARGFRPAEYLVLDEAREPGS